jgi:hypothetical protein
MEYGDPCRENKTARDGRRTRPLLAYYFNGFCRGSLLDPLYPAIIAARGAALEFQGKAGIEKYLPEANRISELRAGL